jgi:hypothetical protein
MPDHVARCTTCYPEIAPSGGRTGPHHVGIRFNPLTEGIRWQFLLDGNEVKHVLEAVAGPKGWIYHHQDRPGGGGMHPCENCGKAVCARLLFGRVQIFRDDVEIIAPHA